MLIEIFPNRLDAFYIICLPYSSYWASDALQNFIEISFQPLRFFPEKSLLYEGQSKITERVDTYLFTLVNLTHFCNKL